MKTTSIVDLEKFFAELMSDIDSYLGEARSHIEGGIEYSEHYIHPNPNRYWDHLPEETQVKAAPLIKRLLGWSAQFTPLLKEATLASESDVRDVALGVKTIRAAISLRKFRHWDADYLHDEDVVLGISPEKQSDSEPLDPESARKEAVQASRKILDVAQLVGASGALVVASLGASERVDRAARYRPGTAFVMMWMERTKPELDDVYEAVKDVFAEFDIKAVRADDIEHEGLITQRVINEISTSEFLFADLSGQRPNVYYEVGYAHALGKRVILFRKAGDSLHFDLAGYNCPSYANNKDLKEKLRKRLIELTNREPKGKKAL